MRTAMDEAEFVSIYLAWAAPLVAYLTRLLRDRHTALDITHDVLLKALEQDPGAGRSTREVGAWLMRTGHNAAISHLRRERRSVCEDPATIDRRRDATPPPDEWGATEAIHEQIALLGPLVRRVIEMLYREDLTVHEVGSLLGKSPAAVRQLQFRGLGGIRRGVQPRT